MHFGCQFFQPKDNQGQIEFVPGSHLWGHIPHRNREPVSLPKTLKYLKQVLMREMLYFFTPYYYTEQVNLNQKITMPDLH